MERKAALLNAMKLVYEWEMGGEGGATTYHEMLEEKSPEQSEVTVDVSVEETDAEPAAEKPITDEGELYMFAVVEGVRSEAEVIDSKIEGYLRRWSLDRLSRVDLAILRVATWELMHGAKPAVAINAAVEMAKAYSDERSGSFVNGVLGNMARDMAADK